MFAETRRLSDAVLVGAGTIRAEHYKPFRANPRFADERAALGLAAAPLLVIVSASLHLPWADPVFSESAIRPLVMTVEGCDTAALSTARQHAEVALLPGTHVDPAALLDHLRSRGLLRIVCEGGPHLLSEMSHAKVLDEADITVAPLIVGGGQKVTGTPMFEPDRFRLVHSISDDGYLFNRYVTV